VSLPSSFCWKNLIIASSSETMCPEMLPRTHHRQWGVLINTALAIREFPSSFLLYKPTSLLSNMREEVALSNGDTTGEKEKLVSSSWYNSPPKIVPNQRVPSDTRILSPDFLLLHIAGRHFGKSKFFCFPFSRFTEKKAKALITKMGAPHHKDRF
jgi:hypothetical protein